MVAPVSNVVPLPPAKPKLIWVQVDERAWNSLLKAAEDLRWIDDRRPEGPLERAPRKDQTDA
jgi:hypothetical protein